jgi:hypothetical protein
VKRVTEQGANAETTENKGLNQVSSVVNRDMILQGLKDKIAQLDQWATQSHTIKDPIRVSCVRGEIYAYSIMLSGLRDKELDDLKGDVDAIKKHVGMVKE